MFFIGVGFPCLEYLSVGCCHCHGSVVGVSWRPNCFFLLFIYGSTVGCNGNFFGFNDNLFGSYKYETVSLSFFNRFYFDK